MSLAANPPFNDSDTAFHGSARHSCEAYPQVIRGAKDSWSKDDDVRFFSLSASNGDLRSLGGDERNSPEVKARRGPNERARASHWAGVRCRNPLPPPKGNANFAWVQHFIHCILRSLGEGGHLAPQGMGGFVLANGSMSSNQSGDCNARPRSAKRTASNGHQPCGGLRKATARQNWATNSQGLGSQSDIQQKLIEADLVDCMVALPGQLFYSTQIPVCLWFIAKNKHAEAKVGPSPGSEIWKN